MFYYCLALCVSYRHEALLFDIYQDKHLSPTLVIERIFFWLLITINNLNLFIMIVLILIIVLLTIVSAIYAIKHQNDAYSDTFEVSMAITAILFSISIGICIGYIVTFLQFRSNIIEFKSFENTLMNARISNNDFESIGIQSHVADWNEWLAKSQYKHSWWVNCVPDEIMELKPIK